MGSVIVVGLVGFDAVRRARSVRGFPDGRALRMRDRAIDLAGRLRVRVTLVRVPARVREPLRARWCRLRYFSHSTAPRYWARASDRSPWCVVRLGSKATGPLPELFHLARARGKRGGNTVTVRSVSPPHDAASAVFANAVSVQFGRGGGAAALRMNSATFALSCRCARGSVYIACPPG